MEILNYFDNDTPPVNPAPLSCRPKWRRTSWAVMKRRHLQASKMFL